MISLFQVAFDAATLTASPTFTEIGGGDTYRLARSFQTARGRSSELDKTGTGTASVDFIDIHGVLDPTNAGSPFANKLDPMKQARIAIVNPWKLLNDADATVYSLFRGFVDTWGDMEVDQSGNFITGQIQLVDALDLFAQLRMMPQTHGDASPSRAVDDVYFSGGPNGYSAGTDVAVDDRIFKILDDIGWPTALRNVFSGNVRVLEQVYARADQALSAIDDAADAEFPFVANRFIRKDGVFAFRGRFARFFPEHYDVNTWLLGGRPQAEADPENVVVISRLPAFRRSAQDLVNAALAIPSGASDTDVPGNLVTDPTSIGKYGYRNLDTQDLLTYEGLAGGLTTAIEETRKFADYRVGNYKNPQTRIGQIVVAARDPRDPLAKPLWEFLCGVELGDIVTLTTSHPGGGGFTDEDFYVESISYQGEPAPPPKHYHLVCTLDVSPRRFFDYNPFGDDPIT